MFVVSWREQDGAHQIGFVGDDAEDEAIAEAGAIKARGVRQIVVWELPDEATE